MAAFSEMGVMPEIAQAVEEMDWLLPTDIQAESIPLILGGGDVLMAAETGSGKTGVSLTPFLQTVFLSKPASTRVQWSFKPFLPRELLLKQIKHSNRPILLRYSSSGP
ncbi:ATP-dependent RNA helicase DDX1-like [Salvelinus namaycush]|uniref:ATP-dependent RNA helicase n=1 Tax=Salvelinus namaycush TaxID=8040 RepID=A0A8U0QBI3_SALNM|nr:ATP-dependent RNA helicase DDX1-like [Salvelinus namaycush]